MIKCKCISAHGNEWWCILEATNSLSCKCISRQNDFVIGLMQREYHEVICGYKIWNRRESNRLSTNKPLKAPEASKALKPPGGPDLTRRPNWIPMFAKHPFKYAYFINVIEIGWTPFIGNIRAKALSGQARLLLGIYGSERFGSENWAKSFPFSRAQKLQLDS